MRDVLPLESNRLTHIEDTFRRVLESYAYEEIRLPIVESRSLFSRGLGESTDAVSKEMYEFHDRDGEVLALRPEGTASCARAVLSNNMCYNDKPRLWYAGPMFRHERPQAGRYRQFQQIGAEAFGYVGPYIDAELIHIVDDVFRHLELSDHVTLLINNIGTAADRRNFRSDLVEYLQDYYDDLDGDSQRRLSTNPLRILDSKIRNTQSLLNGAPVLSEYVNGESLDRFAWIKSNLESLDISYRVDERLVRGFDYYTDTVFEWVTNEGIAQDAICAGGRYDGLVELLGGRPTPAVGFAAGIERIALALERKDNGVEYRSTDVYVIPIDEMCREYSSGIARFIRENSNLRVREHNEEGKMKTKMRWADRSDATWALVLGENEVATESVTVKWLRERNRQESVPKSKIAQVLMNNRSD